MAKDMSKRMANKASRSTGHVPLARALSKLGVLSRSQAIAAVLEGRVRVHGEVVREPGRLVSPERDDLRVDDAPAHRQATRVIALHKPRGYVTTRSDPQGRPTVYDLLPADALAAGVQAVGRLDLATSGLLLFTNDTRLAAWLTDPSSGVPRTYLVTVRGELGDDTLARLLAEGVEDAGEVLRPRQATIRKRSGRETHLIVVLDEGRNREIRRMFASLGPSTSLRARHEVIALKRVSFGPVELGDLPPGKTREVDAGVFPLGPPPQP